MRVHVSLPSPSANFKGLEGGEIGKRLNKRLTGNVAPGEQIFGVKGNSPKFHQGGKV